MHDRITLLPHLREEVKRHLLPRNTAHIFTDGSCYRKDGTGGYAAIILFNDEAVAVSDNKLGTTNNEMELMGILAGLNRLTSNKYPILVHSDSQYAVNAVTKWYRSWMRYGWTTQSGAEVKNKELIEQIVTHPYHGTASFEWVRGHNGHAFNEWADELAGLARKDLYRTHDVQLVAK